MKKARLLAAAIVVLTAAAVVGIRISGRMSSPQVDIKSGLKNAPTNAEAANPVSDGNQVLSRRALVYPEVVEAATKAGKRIPDLLAFVSNSIRNEAYDGALRGPRGTLLANAGNSVDKALLLRDLLRTSLPQSEVRFAFCSLASGEAEGLVSGTEAQNKNEPAARPGSLKNASAVQLAKESASYKDHKATIDVTIEHWQGLADTVRQNAKILQATLSQHGVRILGPSVTHAQLVEAVSSHIWVQYHEGSEWVDLDPTISGGVVGNHLCAPRQTAAELPDEFYHHLSINILLEERQNGQVSTRPALETDWRTADLAGSTITYIQAEPFGLTKLANDSSMPPPGMRRYTPVLLIDEAGWTGASFNLPSPKSGAKPMGEIVGTQVGGILGSHSIGSLGQPQNDTAAQKAEVIGVWLQFVVSSPHGPADIVERPVLDRIGYAARALNQRESAPAAPMQLAGDEYVPMMAAWSIAIWTGEQSVPLSFDAKFRQAIGNARSGGLRGVFEDLGFVHRSYYQMRTSLFRLARDGSPSFLYSGPDVSVLKWSPDPVTQGSRFTVDVASRNISPAPDVGDSGSNEFLWAEAVLESERSLLDSAQGVDPARKASEDTAPDVENIFARAQREHVQTIFLGPTDTNVVDTIVASDDARMRIRTRLTEGRFVLIPARAITVGNQPVIGWWSFDPQQIMVSDEMENGSHQAGSESPMTVREESEKNTEASSRYVSKFKRGVCLLARAVYFTMAVTAAKGDLKAGDIPKAIEDVQDAVDAIEGTEVDCGKGESPIPEGPVGENDPGKDFRFPKPSNSPLPKGPNLSKRPPFRGLPRGR